MQRTLTAAVALAAGLGLAGLAQAQTSTNPASPTGQSSPSMSQPLPNGSTGSSAAPSHAVAPSGGTAAPSPGAMNPSASAGQPGAAAGNQANSASTQPATSMGSKQANMLSQSEIQTAQQELKAQGLYRGAIDGIVGPETQQALSQFQARNGLPQTADLDQQTLDRLNGGSNGGQRAPQPATR